MLEAFRRGPGRVDPILVVHVPVVPLAALVGTRGFIDDLNHSAMRNL